MAMLRLSFGWWPDGFRYDFGHLFESRAFVEVFFIKGVDLEVKRHQDGSITFNGIELEKLLASDEDAAPDQQAEAEPEEPGFGAGVDRRFGRKKGLFSGRHRA